MTILGQELREATVEGIAEELPETLLTIDMFGDYYRAARKYPLLTAEDEVRLSKEIEVGLFAAERIENDDNTPDDLQDLIHLKTIGESSKETMITSNLRLVFSIATKYRNRGLETEDLVNEGIFGLIRAVEKFDYKKGNKFSTYAINWIRESIESAIHKKSRVIELPEHVSREALRQAAVITRLTSELERRPTRDEIVREMGTTPRRVDDIEAFHRTTSVMSTDQLLDDSNGNSLRGIGAVGSFEQSVVDQDPAVQMEKKDIVQSLLDQAGLRPDEVDALSRHYGLRYEPSPGNTIKPCNLKTGVLARIAFKVRRASEEMGLEPDFFESMI